MHYKEAIRIASESLPTKQRSKYNGNIIRAARVEELEDKYADFCKGKREWLFSTTPTCTLFVRMLAELKIEFKVQNLGAGVKRVTLQ